MRVSPRSTEYLRLPVRATERGMQVDPTAAQVQFAFKPEGVPPTEADWVGGEWEPFDGRWLARCLVGPSGAVQLPAGRLDAWVRVLAIPEQPEHRAGTVLVEP